jgi:hypothetical protein
VNKKFLLLFLGLVLPVLVFIFLKFFGKNEFDVPLPHADGVKQVPGGCDLDYSVPYHVNDSLLRKMQPTATAPLLTLVNFDKETVRLNDIEKKFTRDEVFHVSADKINFGVANLDSIKRCVLLIEEPATIVLIDNDRNIRGYYNGNDRDELDRLEAEITIILKKY